MSDRILCDRGFLWNPNVPLVCTGEAFASSIFCLENVWQWKNFHFNFHKIQNYISFLLSEKFMWKIRFSWRHWSNERSCLEICHQSKTKTIKLNWFKIENEVCNEMQLFRLILIFPFRVLLFKPNRIVIVMIKFNLNARNSLRTVAMK